MTVPESPLRLPFAVRQLPARKATRFDLAPDATTRAALARHAGLLEVPFLRFQGEIAPAGRRDLTLHGRLEAVVVQPCSVTLEPVTTRLAETVERRYLADYAEPTAEEVELDGEDGDEPLPEVIDPGAVATEALILALPLYPRAAGASLGEAAFSPPGAAPFGEGERRPFAGLEALRAELARKDEEPS